MVGTDRVRPLVGAIVLIVFACTASGPPNKYGDGPDGKGNMTATSPLGQTLPPPTTAAQSPPPSDMPPLRSAPARSRPTSSWVMAGA